MKLRQAIIPGCFLAGITLASCGKDDDELNNTDRNFMTMTSISNSAEVSAASLAITKATNPTVRAFAQHMIAEHGMAQTDLKNLGNSVGFTVKDTIDPAHVAIAAQLSTMSGRTFDSAYMHTQVMDHQMTLNNFKNEQDDGQHKEVRNYADNYRPHIEMHLQRADSIANAFFKR